MSVVCVCVVYVVHGVWCGVCGAWCVECIFMHVYIDMEHMEVTHSVNCDEGLKEITTVDVCLVHTALEQYATDMHADTHACMHAHTHARTHTHAHTHTRTHAHTASYQH